MRDRDWRLKEGTKQTEGRMQTGHGGGEIFFFFFFFLFPSYISGGHHFWVRFLRM